MKYVVHNRISFFQSCREHLETVISQYVKVVEDEGTLCWLSGLIEAIPRLDSHSLCGGILLARKRGSLEEEEEVRKAQDQHRLHIGTAILILSNETVLKFDDNYGGIIWGALEGQRER